jgi:hypothetical protein
MKIRKTLFITFSLLLLNCSLFQLKAQTVIPPGFFGLNGWMPDKIGSATSPGPTMTIPTGTNLGGQLYNFTTTALSTSTAGIGVKMLRYGGIAHDLNLPTVSQYTTFVAMCNSLSITPVVQLSFSNYYWQTGPSYNATVAITNATSAISSLVTTLSGAPYNVKYFSIGNEPDGYTGYPYYIPSTYSISPATLNYYTKALSDVVKTVNPNAIVIASDISFMQTNYLNGLIFGPGDITSTSTVTGKPYCDILAWHTYPYDGTQVRSDIIGQPSHSVSYGLTYDLNNIRNRILTSAAVPGNIKLAVTEMNVDWQHTTASNTIAGQSSNSFLAGQWMAEMYATALNTSTTGVAPVAFMMPWSLHESSGDQSTNDKGLINSTSTTTPQYRSTYVHTKLMAEGFGAGKFFMGSVNTNTNVKVFSANDCSHLAIMIMNQESATAHTVSINHATTYPTNGTANAKLNITPAPSWSNFTVSIGARETILQIYDACHNLMKQYVYNESANSTYTLPVASPSVGVHSRFCACKNTITTSYPNYSLRCADPAESGGVHYNTYTLTADTRIKDSAYITGAITVPNGKTLTIDTAEVSLAASAKIIVQSGGILKITGSSLHGCPGSTWGGIKVTGNNTTAQFTLTTSEISGANNGVVCSQAYMAQITDNVFTGCNLGIGLKQSKGFTITGNEFTDVVTCIKTASTVSNSSSIAENLFFEPDTAIIFTNDEHNHLDISCNGFIDYTTYGIYSTGGTLQQQGTSDYGAGNFFSSTSAETNHQLYFTGAGGVTYYYDPSNPITLSTSSPLTATATAATNDGSCDQIEGRLANHGITKEENKNQMQQGSSDQAINKINKLSPTLNCIPNPTNDFATIQFSLADNERGELLITNSFGQIMKRVVVAASDNRYALDCSGYGQGVYYITLQTDKKQIEKTKLIIIK